MQIARDDAQELRVRRRFLARHPKSELYAGFGDFSFWRLNVVSAHLNGGFARAADLKPHKIEGTMAFMFESRHVIRPTRWAMETPLRQPDYDAAWSGFPKAQLP